MGKKVTRFDDWPDRDRCDWERAIADGDIFDERGPGATWSEGTRCTVGRGYGRWIGHLLASRPDLLDCSPADRVTPGHVRAYVDMLNAGISPAGTFNYVKHLYDAIRVMAPGRDWTWLKDIAWRLNRYVIPRPKRGRMVDAERLLDLGLTLMDTAEALDTNRPLERAIQYRDGLAIAVLITAPIRRRNLTDIRVGRHLIEVGAGYMLIFESDETKTHAPLDYPVAGLLVPYMRRYLAQIRPRFSNAQGHDGLWASAKGRPMSGQALYKQVGKRTKSAFGHPINLHLFRDIAATTFRTRAPEHAALIGHLLGHTGLATAERHYVQARAIEAGRCHQATIQKLRDGMAGTDRDGPKQRRSNMRPPSST